MRERVVDAPSQQRQIGAGQRDYGEHSRQRRRFAIDL